MNFWRILTAVLREIFEESAFERYCVREGLPRDRASYAGFLRDCSAQKTNIRCC